VYVINAIAEDTDNHVSHPTTWTDISILPPYTLDLFGLFVPWYFVVDSVLLILVVGFGATFAYYSFIVGDRKHFAYPLVLSFWVLCAVFVVMSAVAYVLWSREYYPPSVYWKNTDIPCIHRVHSYADVYSSAKFEISVDGVPQDVPTEIGFSPQCVAQIHTHDDVGYLHFEQHSMRPVTLGDFFTVAGQSIERGGYMLSVVINGEDRTKDVHSYALQNGDAIVIRYTVKAP